MNKKRRALLIELERIIGRKCYNGSIQNFAPGGIPLGEGRSFRYKLTLIKKNGERVKPALPGDLLQSTDTEFRTAHYKFGANELGIMRGLEEVLTYLEEHHGLKIAEDGSGGTEEDE